MTAAIYPFVSYLPDTFTFDGDETVYSKWGAFYSVICGLWSGFIIGLITEIYTSNAYSPV